MLTRNSIRVDIGFAISARLITKIYLTVTRLGHSKGVGSTTVTQQQRKYYHKVSRLQDGAVELPWLTLVLETVLDTAPHSVADWLRWIAIIIPLPSTCLASSHLILLMPIISFLNSFLSLTRPLCGNAKPVARPGVVATTVLLRLPSYI